MTAAEAFAHPGRVYDVYAGQNFPFRVLQNASRAELDRYCAERGYVVTSEQQQGVRYFDAYVAKAGRAS